MCKKLVAIGIILLSTICLVGGQSIDVSPTVSLFRVMVSEGDKYELVRSKPNTYIQVDQNIVDLVQYDENIVTKITTDPEKIDVWLGSACVKVKAWVDRKALAQKLGFDNADEYEGTELFMYYLYLA